MPTAPSPSTTTVSLRHLTRVQAQLQPGLDQREQGGQPGIGARRERDDVGLGDDEPVLVRVEREDQRPRQAPPRRSARPFRRSCSRSGNG